MTHIEFSEVLRLLQTSFDVTIASPKADAWYRQLHEWPVDRFRRLVTLALAECERFPALAWFVKNRDRVPGAAVAPRTACPICDSTGLVHTTCAGAAYAWRCPECANWAGRADGYPVWHPLPGHTVTSHAEWNPHDPLMVKGLALLGPESVAWRAATPAMRTAALALRAARSAMDAAPAEPPASPGLRATVRTVVQQLREPGEEG